MAAKPANWMWNNFADVATITATDANPNFPVTNIQTTFRQQLWQSVNVTGAKWVYYDHGAPINMTAAIIQDHNFSATATVEWHGSTDNFVSSDVLLGTFTMTRVDNGASIVINPLVLLVSNVAYQYTAFKITDSSNTAGFFSIGRTFLGTCTAMTLNYMSGMSITPTSLSQVDRSLNGVVHVSKKPTYRVIEMRYHVVQVAQKDAVRQIIDAAGIDAPFWIQLMPSDAGNDLYTIYGRFLKLPALINTRWVLWDFVCQIAEDV